MSIVGRLLQCLAARLHGAGGWLAYRLGCRRTARHHFERVLMLRGADFAAYVHLGRIAFDCGDYAGWRRELEHARRLDPVRFARLRHPPALHEPRLAGTTFAPVADHDDFDGTGERATWHLPRAGGAGREPRNESIDTALDALLPGLDELAETTFGRPMSGRLPDDGRATSAHDDCTSATERVRFQRLGPIRAADVTRCDLDALAKKLAE